MADRMGLKGGDKVVKIGTKELLVGGDVILEIAGIKITPEASTLKAIRNKIQGIGQGNALSLKVLRAGEIKVLSTVMP